MLTNYPPPSSIQQKGMTFDNFMRDKRSHKKMANDFFISGDE